MNRKTELLSTMRGLIEDSGYDNLSLELQFSLPYSGGEHCETIISNGKWIINKLYYIVDAYNDDLQLKVNQNVVIIGYNYYYSDTTTETLN